ncbi:MAG: LacI family DNA-binding transcriptional regulator [Sphaerochaetaceae bacterium]|jgi:LacI family transcriptional regulator|nr:LacI family transcriptional regulator [Sphaerochaetaceae bacterium]NLO61432.1 LacI family transcriptional regulator [Spirochaetales bacterium]MDD2406293.1 LacI family DNA-binding transcriptional regulator [Sphaerochaetaceae bacterium]MDD3669919.1 LacI family DNA-binding transcriptional regulator [Sphaerochaetaceae bacterium]MDD4258562.1 LacI family DNA-binding transcriptional regulator [Sphaerochaetaceae bacterium]
MSDSANSKHVTLKDLAIATGFSINTISRALKDKADISTKTKMLVKKKAEEMGYLANMVAVSMRYGKTHTVAIIVPDIANPFFSSQVKEFNRLLRSKGYTSIIFDTEENGDLELEAVKTAISRKVDGIIICPTQRREDIFKLMEDNSLPYVIFARRFPHKNLFNVLWDDIQSGYQATEYLISKGKRRILFLNGPSHISSSVDRLAGYVQCLYDNHIQIDSHLVVEANILETGHCDCIETILKANIEFDAIFAFSDFIAFTALNMLRIAGISVPVVGVDDILSDFNVPIRLTSVGADKKKKARSVITMLYKQMQSETPITPYTIMIEPHLVVRDT